ncbi:hypothetical protein Tco_0086717 [Tanacetum coccineum]
MADAEHAPAMAPPVRTDEQIMPRIRWVPIGKSNCYLNEEKSQPSPISCDTMTHAVHAPAMAPPVRTDEQILPRIRWVPIGKSNCYLNEEKSQPDQFSRLL